MRTYDLMERDIIMKLSWEATSKTFKAQMIGKLLGDGCITKQKGRKPRFQYMHVYSDYGYSKFCYNYLAKYIPLNPPKHKKTIDIRLTKGYSISHYTQSRTDNIITYLRLKWYPNSTKILPYHSIEKYFTLESLAWWYMNDGHLKINNNVPEKIILSTDSFHSLENQWLLTFYTKNTNSDSVLINKTT